MTLMYEEHVSVGDWDPDELKQVVSHIHDDLDLPEGYRVEIIEGQIVMSPAPQVKHAHIVKLIAKAVDQALPDGFEVYENVTLEDPEGERCIPDLGAWPEKFLDAERLAVLPGDKCAFVLEVTSPRQENRDYTKAAAYARCDIPVYLLVDRKKRVCVVHTEPRGSVYTTVHTAAFGEPLVLTLHREVSIDTGRF